MTRFDDYTAAVNAGRVNLAWRFELIDVDGRLLASTDADAVRGSGIHWGAKAQPLMFSTSTVSQRTARVTLPVSDADLMPDRAGTHLHPETAHRVRLYAGATGPGPQSTAEINWLPQATMMVNTATGTLERGVATLDLDLVDTLRPVRSEFVDLFTFASGEAVETVVGRVLAQVLPTYTLAPTGFVTPSGSQDAGASRLAFVEQLLSGCGHELVTDPLGAVSSRPIPPSTADPAATRWRYGQADGIPVHKAERVWTPRVPQGWRVEGGSFQSADPPITFTVYDLDPTSEGYYRGTGETAIQTSRLPFVSSVAQAASAGYGQLRRNGVGPMRVKLWSIPNPMMREHDLIDLELDALNATGTFHVLSYELPLLVDGLMMIEARKVYDPALGFVLPNAATTCVATITDTFTRADQNLEHLPPASPGSPDWTEHGWSWGVVNNEAVQRYEGWSMALRTVPLCQSDQTVSIVVSACPTGKRIGPVIRSTGAFDGYAALVDASGRVSLEYWQGGSTRATLGSHNHGSPPTGKTVAVAVAGSTITVSLNGNVVITATDSRAAGTHVGMLAYGGWVPNVPAATNFSAS